MLDMNEIDRAIAELEAREITFTRCAKLADLYTIKSHVEGLAAPYEREYSRAAEPEPETRRAGVYGDSDFLGTVSGKEMAAAWSVMDELMDTLHVVNPKVYESVMRKIRNLQ